MHEGISYDALKAEAGRLDSIVKSQEASLFVWRIVCVLLFVFLALALGWCLWKMWKSWRTPKKEAEKPTQ